MVRFEALDAWRGICAILVVLFHFCFIFQSPLSGERLIANAYLFVDFFFVLSGFVVAHAYAARLNSGAAWGAFVVRRFGRLWPLHGAMLAAFIAFIGLINLVPHPERFDLTAGPGEYSLIAIPIHLFLLNAMNLHGMAWNAPSWSIGAEFYTYLLFGALCVLVLRRGALWALGVAGVGLAVLAMASPTYMNSTADFGLFRCVAGFFTGVAAHALHRRLGDVRLPGATLWEVAAVVMAGLFVVHAGSGPDEVAVLSLAAPLAFGAAVLVFAREEGALSRLLRARPFAALGRWSYSIYMTHQLVLVGAICAVWALGAVETRVAVEGHEKALYDLGGTVPSLLLLALMLAVVLALSAFTHARIEEPARRAFNAFAGRLEQGTAVRRAYAMARRNVRQEVPGR
ncbi:acyltransferase [Aquabacter sp. CN5-332]|uniref:acyltransferase family protein n=1 Tax=Aquabacter sp. CN5-332 TaxID=3156608 RepID=UPI0032B40075